MGWKDPEAKKEYMREYRKTEKYKKMRKAWEEKTKDKYKERRKQYAKEYHLKPEVQKYRKEYREKHRERIIERKRAHYRENKERILKEQKEYYEKIKNNEEFKAKNAMRNKRWQDANRDYVRTLQKMDSANLADNCVKSFLSCPNQDDRKKGKKAIPRELITKEMIEMKRELVKTRRLLRQYRKENGLDKNYAKPI